MRTLRYTAENRPFRTQPEAIAELAQGFNPAAVDSALASMTETAETLLTVPRLDPKHTHEAWAALVLGGLEEPDTAAQERELLQVQETLAAQVEKLQHAEERLKGIHVRRGELAAAMDRGGPKVEAALEKVREDERAAADVLRDLAANVSKLRADEDRLLTELATIRSGHEMAKGRLLAFHACQLHRRRLLLLEMVDLCAEGVEALSTAVSYQNQRLPHPLTPPNQKVSLGVRLSEWDEIAERYARDPRDPWYRPVPAVSEREFRESKPVPTLRSPRTTEEE